MRRCLSVFVLAAVVAMIALLSGPSIALAQGTGEAPTLPSLERGPGGYLSLVKLSLIAIVFLAWVRAAEWVNRDAIKLVKRLDMLPELWNPIIVGSFLIGFLIAISVPMFLVGYPIFVLSALMPPMAYFLTRRSKIAESPSVARALAAKPGEEADAEALPQDDGVEMSFSPAGADKPQQQANLIQARQSAGFVDAKTLLNEGQFKRADQIMLDFSRDRVSSKLMVDGVWHPREPMEREPGDAMLVSLKHLAGLNAKERRARQNGSFSIKSELGKAKLELTSQGVKTGERAVVQFVAKAKDPLTLHQAGMLPTVETKVKTVLNGKGLGIVSAPAGAGLSTSWQAALATTDRLTRDIIALVEDGDHESEVENITQRTYAEPEKQIDELKKLLLTQPDMLIVPTVTDKATMDLLTLQVTSEDRSVLTRVKAKSAAEALLKMYAKAGDREQFLEAVQFVTCQRLVRRLCDACKQEVRANPKVVQQLGGDPKKQKTLQMHWRLPPPDQRVDEKGRDIEFPPCTHCGGIGYLDRIAVFEFLEVNDQIRATLKLTPKVDAIESVARKTGKRSLSAEAYQLVLYGVTSLPEIQRLLKQEK